MIVKVDKNFEKDTNKIKNSLLLNKIANCLETVQRAKTIHQIPKIKKLKGFEQIYRIRIGDYRLGIYINDDVVEFIRCLHRKDIYKYFPK